MAVSSRDLRIDFLRGLSLIIIAINHLEQYLDFKLLRYFTFQTFGISDAACLFVMTSGYLYGSIYIKNYHLYGILHIFKKSWQRAAKIYGFYLISSILIIVIHSLMIQFYDLSQSPIKDMQILLNQLRGTFWNMILLKDAPNMLGILPLYILFLLVMPGVLGFMDYNFKYAWFLMVSIYILAQVFHFYDISFNLWFIHHSFNPYAWQLLFFTGMSLGYLKQNQRVIPRISLPYKIVLGFCLLMVGLLNKWLPVFAHWGWVQLKSNYPYYIPLTYKSDLGPILFLHFMLLALFIFQLIPSKNHIFWKSRWIEPIVICGQFPLHVYIAGLILNHIEVCLMKIYNLEYIGLLLMQISTVIILIQLAYHLKFRREAYHGS